MPGIATLQFSPVPEYFCGGWVKSSICTSPTNIINYKQFLNFLNDLFLFVFCFWVPQPTEERKEPNEKIMTKSCLDHGCLTVPASLLVL